MSQTDYREQIEKAIAYIEENLCSEALNTESVARAAGYSKYHFSRIFCDICGMTPTDYIRKRRISEIVRHMRTEHRPISEIAFAYGFNSKENFIRAFKSEHGILPTQLRAADNSLKLYDRLRFVPESFQPAVEICSLEPFRIIAYQSDTDEPPRFWNRYNAEKRSVRLSGGKTAADFGVCKWNTVLGRLDYFIGIREEDAVGDRSGTVTLDICGGTYAVFDTPPATYFDFVAVIRRTWDYIRDIWLPENHCIRTGDFELECYTEQSRQYTERIYIPINKPQNERN